MQCIHTVADLRAALADARDTAFVPTMGNLHAGHVSLVELAKRNGHPVVASLFVNPLQFGAGEDFERYPRTLEADCGKLAAAGCDLVFAPDVAEMYPVPQTFTLRLTGPLAQDLEGHYRPGHLDGVATVVLKLFHLVRPAVAIFGRKDYQQLRVVDELTRQFNLAVAILAGDTLREPDGLAMSSRNSYLSSAERRQAPQLQQALAAVVAAAQSGNRDFEALAGTARRHLNMAGWRVEYIAVRDAQTLAPPHPACRDFVVLGAAWLGSTRLLDNLGFSLAPPR